MDNLVYELQRKAPGMKRNSFYGFAGSVTLLASVSCSSSIEESTSGLGALNGTGPFDRSGNYLETWADSPSSWRKHPRQARVSKNQLDQYSRQRAQIAEEMDIEEKAGGRKKLTDELFKDISNIGKCSEFLGNP